MVLRAPPCCSQPCQEASGFPGGIRSAASATPSPWAICAAAFRGMTGSVYCTLWPRDCGASLAGRIRLRHEIGRSVLGHAVNRRAEHGVPIVVIVRQV